MERSYRNLGYVLLVLLPIFVAGFWIPYFSEIPHFDETITMAVHVHAASLFCFLLLLIVQLHTLQSNLDTSHSWEILEHRDTYCAHLLCRDVVEGISRALDRRRDAHAMHDLHRAGVAASRNGESAWIPFPRTAGSVTD